MRKIIVGLFISLDGVVEAPEKWTFPYQNEETMQVMGENMYRTDAMLLGRKTYDTYAATFAHQTGGIADYLNGTPKYVVSNTKQSADWNNSTLISGNVADEIARIKRGQGKDIMMNGSPSLVQSLMQHDLIDEYSLMVFPLVLGSGQRLFGEGTSAKLKLVSSRSLSTGVVHLKYERAE